MIISSINIDFVDWLETLKGNLVTDDGSDGGVESVCSCTLILKPICQEELYED